MGEKIFIKLQHGKQVQQIELIDQQLWHHLDRSRIGELLRASSETLEQKAPDISHLQWRADPELLFSAKADISSRSVMRDLYISAGIALKIPIAPLPKVPI